MGQYRRYMPIIFQARKFVFLMEVTVSEQKSFDQQWSSAYALGPSKELAIEMLDFQGRLRKPNLDGGLEVKGQVRGNKVYIVLRSPQRVMTI
jgi:hypothetical protein